ncbi:MAG: hypothetical protein MUE68_03055 [Bacteroidetes bacterium]|jgi:hypothetical protein|nr:hypothetical protein [Bacteroidota bacterium]
MQTLWLGIVVGAAMSVGAWIARRWIDHIPVGTYQWAVRGPFFLTAASLLVPF